MSIAFSSNQYNMNREYTILPLRFCTVKLSVHRYTLTYARYTG